MKTGREITLEEQIEQQLRTDVWRLESNGKELSDIVWKQLNEHIDDEKRKD
ncbi:MAG TPA: hypothetical protein VH500_12465 [Nitrososphaeraceae archaeon]|jgi:hypothetical protein